MKFRFCGDADCPDWLLMQINTLSVLSVEILEELCESVALSLLGQELDYKRIEELTSNTRLDRNDSKACISALSLILRSAACHRVSAGDLSAELEQLGLDRTHSTPVSSAYSNHVQRITEKLRNESLRVGRLKETKIEKEGSNLYKMEMKVWNEEKGVDERASFRVDKSQLELLISDLKSVKSRMEELQDTDK